MSIFAENLKKLRKGKGLRVSSFCAVWYKFAPFSPILSYHFTTTLLQTKKSDDTSLKLVPSVCVWR